MGGQKPFQHWRKAQNAICLFWVKSFLYPWNSVGKQWLFCQHALRFIFPGHLCFPVHFCPAVYASLKVALNLFHTFGNNQLIGLATSLSRGKKREKK